MRRVYPVPVILPVFLFFSSFLMVPFFSTGTAAESRERVALESVQVMRIVPQDGKALIQVPGGKPRIIRSGDLIGEKSRVAEIAEGRIVIEERTATGIETVIIRVEGKKQRVERIKKVEEQPPVLLRPQ